MIANVLISTAQARQMLGVGKTKFAQLSASLNCVRYSSRGKRLWKRAEIEALIERHTERAPLERIEASREVMGWFAN